MNPDTLSLCSRAQIIGSAQSVPSNGRSLMRFTTSSRRMRGEMFSGMNRSEKPMMWYSASVAAVTNAIAALASRGVRHEPAARFDVLERGIERRVQRINDLRHRLPGKRTLLALALRIHLFGDKHRQRVDAGTL